ncbi:cytochrome P450 [Pseudomaricurvus alkylphenolicus]|uniref:cytochrome P450 n=1 Tax=Pseudomaricurvus alkylphenolicus TaxID=1306991 RepID=UPI0014233C10|nr:cytochrome P450 [Pseudomaricurvus alkylphenolicus]NIB38515.1 cytochrome P450 [Pseudomaricurvus alkylphenolicus]
MFEFNPYSREVDVDPFPFYKTLRDDYPCYWSENGQCWVLTRYEDVYAAAQNWEAFSSAKGNMLDDFPERTGRTLGTTDAPRHDHLRSLAQAAFSRKNVNYLIEPIRAIANEEIDKIIDKREFEFIGDFSSPVTVATLSHLLGIPKEAHREIRKNVVLALQADPETNQKGPENIAAFQWLKDYAANMLEERRKNPQDDLLTHLMQAEIEGDKLSDEEVLMTTTTLIMAGVESASSFMTNLMMNLVDHPQVMERLVEDPNRLTDAIEESLRFNTSAQRFRRTLTCDKELHGQTLKAGDKVLLCWGAANRDERKFPNPEVYDLDRKPRGHLGMGTGKHMCLGAPIARLLVKTSMEELLKRIPDLRKADQTLEWISSTTFRAPLALKLQHG